MRWFCRSLGSPQTRGWRGVRVRGPSLFPGPHPLQPRGLLLLGPLASCWTIPAETVSLESNQPFFLNLPLTGPSFRDMGPISQLWRLALPTEPCSPAGAAFPLTVAPGTYLPGCGSGTPSHILCAWPLLMHPELASVCLQSCDDYDEFVSTNPLCASPVASFPCCIAASSILQTKY